MAEDNPPDAMLVRQAIAQENLDVEIYVAGDGEQALAFIRRAEQDTDAPRPDILLLDLNLPKVDGLEVLRSLRGSEKYAGIPVLVMTSSDSPVELAEVHRQGADYFQKPLSYLEFLKIGPTVRRMLEDNGLLARKTGEPQMVPREHL